MPVDAFEAIPEAWARVATAVRDRRHELGLKVRQITAEAQVGSTVWSLVENGKPDNNRLSYSSMGAICRALHWSHDSIQRIAAGQEPIVMTMQTEELELQTRLWRIEEVIRDLLTRFDLLQQALQREDERRLLEEERPADQSNG